MSNKLNESQVRSFMKLASLSPLAETFIDKTGLAQEADMGEEEPMGLEDEEGMPDDAPMEEAGGEVDVMSLVDAIADAISQETGVDVSVEGDEGEAGMEDPMPDAEPLGGEEEAPMDAGAEEDPLPLEEEDQVEEDLAAAGVTLDEDDDLVQEVTRRVARRLLRESAAKSAE
jgi:hypothetical protein